MPSSSNAWKPKCLKLRLGCENNQSGALNSGAAAEVPMAEVLEKAIHTPMLQQRSLLGAPSVAP